MVRLYCPSCKKDVDAVLYEGFYYDWLRCTEEECGRSITCLNPSTPRHVHED